jgi:type I restriction enzyme S subunit
MELKKYKLGDCVEILDNLRVPLSSVQRKELEKVYPYYGAQGVIDYVDDFIFDGNYILVAEDGNNLKSRNEPVALWASGKFWVNNHAHILGEKNGFDLRYIYYVINNTDIKGYISGSAQPKLNQDNLKKIEILLPTIEAQRSISFILSSIDRKIALNRAINRNLEALAKQLYDYWFVQFDFPDENGWPYKSSGGKMVWNEVLKREVPEGWETKTLFESTNVQYGFPFSTESFTEEITDVPVVRIRDILDGTVSAYSYEDTDEKYHLQEGDVLVGMDGNFHMNYWHNNNAYLNQRCVRIRPYCDSPISSIQVLHAIKPYIKAKEQNAKGSTVGHLSDKDMKGLFLLEPKVSQLFNPRKTFDPFLKQIIKNKQEIAALTRQRDELLPLLMNGQVTIE